jgi:type IV pilus biogenesis protein PilP
MPKTFLLLINLIWGLAYAESVTKSTTTTTGAPAPVNHVASLTPAKPSSFSELVSIVTETKLTEAKIKLAEVKNKLRQTEPSGGGRFSQNLSAGESADFNHGTDFMTVQSVWVGLGEAMAVVKVSTNNTMVVRVGDEIPGMGLVSAIDKRFGVKVGGQVLAFDLGEIKPAVSSPAQSLPVIR